MLLKAFNTLLSILERPLKAFWKLFKGLCKAIKGFVKEGYSSLNKGEEGGVGYSNWKHRGPRIPREPIGIPRGF